MIFYGFSSLRLQSAPTLLPFRVAGWGVGPPRARGRRRVRTGMKQDDNGGSRSITCHGNPVIPLTRIRDSRGQGEKRRRQSTALPPVSHDSARMAMHRRRSRCCASARRGGNILHEIKIAAERQPLRKTGYRFHRPPPLTHGRSSMAAENANSQYSVKAASLQAEQSCDITLKAVACVRAAGASEPPRLLCPL